MREQILLCIGLINMGDFISYGNREKVDQDLFLSRFAQFHCFKLRSCTPGGDKVCGFDEKAAFLAYFEDICVMHRANCNKAGIYHVVDMGACDAKKNYTVHFKDEFQFEKILRNTVVPSPTNSAVKKP